MLELIDHVAELKELEAFCFEMCLEVGVQDDVGHAIPMLDARDLIDQVAELTELEAFCLELIRQVFEQIGLQNLRVEELTFNSCRRFLPSSDNAS